MLVLSRKTKEQILIGEDVRITLLRIDGNKVRIGIDAPKHVRVMRGELKSKSDTDHTGDGDDQQQISGREEAFAHPANRVAGDHPAPADSPKIFVGSVGRNGDRPKLHRAPLSDYVTAG